jgi:lysyl-tRNA synthetase class 1
MRERPQKTIRFDPGLPLLRLVDEIDDPSTAGRDERALELSRAGVFPRVGVPFKHLVVVAQAARYDEQETLAILRRTGYADAPKQAVVERMAYVRAWLEAFAPEDLRFVVQPTLPPETGQLDQAQRRFLGRLAAGLEEGMSGQSIHELIYELAGEFEASKPADLFRAIYLSLLGKPRGPRAGAFLAVIGPAFSAQRFTEAAQEAS